MSCFFSFTCGCLRKDPLLTIVLFVLYMRESMGNKLSNIYGSLMRNGEERKGKATLLPLGFLDDPFYCLYPLHLDFALVLQGVLWNKF